MPTTAERPVSLRHRISVSVASDLLAWVHSRCVPGDFGVEGVAMELALQRLHDEQAFVRRECRRLGIPFHDEAFWSLHAGFIRESRPIPAGRPPRGEVRPILERGRAFASIAAGLLEWLRKYCGPRGPFESTSHAVETGLRHLRSIEPSERPVAGIGFPFDGKALMAAYRAGLAKHSR